MDLEVGRNEAPSQDLFVSYHANDDLQVTYAGASFHVIRNYYISPVKRDVSCIHHSFLWKLMSAVYINFLHCHFACNLQDSWSWTCL